VRLCGASTSAESVKLLQPSRTYDANRPLVLAHGRHTGYRFSADGFVVSRRTVSYRHRATRDASGRVYIGNTAYLKVGSGALRGFWVREGPSAHVKGMTLYRTYDRVRAISLAAGRYRGYHVDWLGRVTAARSRTYHRAMVTGVTARAVINGRTYLKFAAGRLAGYWVRDRGAIHFD
jgi:hypothetical protein